VAIVPETRYLPLDGGALAYQDVGRGQRVVVNVLEAIVHLDLLWTDPTWSRQWERFSGDWRTLMLQPRGVGLSDPLPRPLTPQEVAADIAALMDAEGVEHAIVIGSFMTAPAVLAFAAAHPQRVETVMLWNPLVQGPLAPGRARRSIWPDDETADAFAAEWRDISHVWGTGARLARWDPPLATPRNLRLWAMLERTTASPAVAEAYIDAGLRADVVDLLPSVQAPVIARRTASTMMPEAPVRALAELVPDGVYEELPPSRPEQTVTESWNHQWERVAQIVSGVRPGADRQHGSVMFVDVVRSTDRLAAMGDDAWRALLERHEHALRTRLDEFGCDLLKLLGDGALCIFPSTAAAIGCAIALHQDAAELGLELRAGVHAGEFDRRADDVSGLAVHVAARVCAAAEAGQVLVTDAARVLAADAERAFAPVGERELKGIPGTWELFAARAPAQATRPPVPDTPSPRLSDRLVVGTARRAPRVLRALTAGRERLSPRRR
jgi:class 3 adenylate cyclase/pimeloyl-ACP methyl ester carboxylesterase